MKLKMLLTMAGTVLVMTMNGQTLFVPNGTSGIGTSVNGNVGIGTDNPIGNMDVRGAGNIIGNNLYFYGSGLYSGDGMPYARLTEYYGMRFTSPDTRWVFSSKPSLLIGYAPDGRFWGENNLFVAGNIGIGTTTPSQKLEINGEAINGNYTSLLRLATSDIAYGNSGGAMEFAAHNNSGTIQPVAIIASSLTNGAVNNQSGDLRFLTSLSGTMSDKMVIKDNGNILIGKTVQNNVSYRLDVSGKVRADEIVVNTTGADFVFDNNYKLRPLSELETFIRQNKHLPDISPATEMQTNGISIGETQTKLLQKLEETMLYLIEQNKIIQEQNKRIEELERKSKTIN
jgi:hypothetical protein